MLKDRGNLKWNSSFMLPEHVSLIKKVFAEENEIEKPLVDEQQFEEMNLTIKEAIENRSLVNLKYFKDNNLYESQGFIEKLDYIQKKL